MWRKITILFFAALMLVLLASACGGAQPTAVSRQVAAADGDTVSLGDRITLQISPGALEDDAIVTITQATDDHPAPAKLKDAYAVGDAFNIDLGGVELSDPVTLTVAYDPDRLVEDTPHDAAFLAYLDEDREDWLPVHGTVDPDQHVVTVETGHLSWWVPVSWRCPTRPAVGGRLTCVNVTKVEDGDTFCAQWPGEPPRDGTERAYEGICREETPAIEDWPVRLIGIDTPELTRRLPDGTYEYDPECYAVEATNRLGNILEGKRAWLELDPAEALDPTARILAYVWNGSELVNERLVREGFARERHWFPDIGQVPTRKYAERLVAAGDEARSNARGVWGECVEVAYQCHIAFDGWINWSWDGETCGTTGEARQMEAARIWVPPNGFRAEYRAHVASEGWLDWVGGSEAAGTVNRALQMEAIQIRFADAPPNVHIEYRAHVADVGWLEWVRDGATAGTVDEGRPMEALEVRVVTEESVQPIIIEPPPTPTLTATPAPSPTESIPVPTPRPEPAVPVRMIIPSIGVDALIQTLSIDDAGYPEVPTGDGAGQVVAWYDFTALPGEGSNAVFAGHGDWQGPAVFYDLGQLGLRDEIRLIDLHGTELTYSVTETLVFDAADPKGLSVMAPTDTDVITVITEAGSFTGGWAGWSHRLVVRAELVGS